MSYLDKLLQGVEVEWMPLGEVADYEQPTKYLVKTNNYNDNFQTPVLTAGKTFILGYTDETDGIYKASENPVIIFDDFTTANKWVDFDFKAKSSAMKMITSIDESKALLKFIYYWINTLPSGLIEGDHKRQWISNYSNKQIPIPPLSVQKEIVRILDKSTELTAELTVELTAELTARKKQYNYYREQLLDFSGKGLVVSDELLGVSGKREVEWKTLGEVGDYKLTYGSGASAIEFNGETRYVRITDITEEGNLTDNPMSPSSFEEKYLLKEGDILLARSGATVGKNFFFTESMGKSIYAGYLIRVQVNRKIAVPKYIYHYLNSSKYYHFISQTKSSGSQPNINAQQYSSFQIPIPPLAEQARIVSILDTFDTLTTSISEGLPKEIELRKKQYEYYRDMLLTFPKENTEI
jgi:type I restriction enzyme S subunit